MTIEIHRAVQTTILTMAKNSKFDMYGTLLCYSLRLYYIGSFTQVVSISNMSTVSVGAQTSPTVETRVAPRIPDHVGCRYCTTCKEFLPVTNFPSGKRRYSCKKHRWELFGKKAKTKHMANAESKLLETIWLKAYSDSKLFKPVWKYSSTTPESSSSVAKVNITHKEIKKLLKFMVNSFQITSNLVSMYSDLLELGKSTALVPVNPTEIVSRSNAALVPSPVKRQLLKAFRADGVQGYASVLRLVEAQPIAFFRPSTEQLAQMQETLVTNRKTLLPEVEQ
jgi:hypothetical protein